MTLINRRQSVLATALLGCAAAAAQMGGRATLIKDATILVGDGTTIESGSVMILGDRIGPVGTGVEGRGQTIDARGMFITPGFIDVWSGLASDAGMNARPAIATAADSFDPFAKNDIDAALQQGVTTVYIPARAANGVGGLGSVVRLLAGAKYDEYVETADAALSLGLALDARATALDRVRSYVALRQLFADAREYRKTLEDYEDDLKEYNEKIKKRADEEAGKSGTRPATEKSAEKPGEKTPESRSAEPRGPRGGRPPGRRPTDAWAIDNGAAAGGDFAPSAESSAAEPSGDDPGADDPPRPPRPRPGRGNRRPPQSRPNPAEGGPEAPQKEALKDDIKKPAEPRKDVTKEALLRAIDGKLLVRVEAERPEDILNLVDIAEEYNLALAIEGASGAYLVADQLRRAHIAVILPLESPAMMWSDGPRRSASTSAAATLVKAGVPIYIGSATSGGARNLSLAAAEMVGRGVDETTALKSVTSEAAKLLGIERETGRVATGLEADLVLWSGHPFDPASRVERVFIKGREVYNANKSSRRGEPKSGGEEDRK